MKTVENILIVEDEAIIGLELKLELESHGFKTCRLASSSEKAIALAREETPDLLIMDVSLARGRDGIETASQIRAQQDIPLIIVTGYPDAEQEPAVTGLRPLKIFIKPLSVTELVDFIRQQEADVSPA